MDTTTADNDHTPRARHGLRLGLAAAVAAVAMGAPATLDVVDDGLEVDVAAAAMVRSAGRGHHIQPCV